MSGGYQLIEVANGNSAGVSSGAGTTVTSGTAAYGAYVQLIASTPFDTSLVQFSYNLLSNSNNNTNYLTVAIGASGSEVPIIADFYLGFDAQTTTSVPLNIPAGSKISARMWGDGGPDTAKVSACLYDSSLSGLEGYAGIEEVAGVAPNITGNTASGVSGAYGSWAQVVASTRRDYAGLLASLAGQTSQTFAQGIYEIGVGGAGSEVPIIVDQQATSVASTNRSVVIGQLIPIPIPAGTRLSYRTTVSGASPINFRMAIMGAF